MHLDRADSLLDTPVPDEIKNLIAGHSFTLAYRIQNFKLAGQIRKKNPIHLEFIFRNGEHKKIVNVAFDGMWKFDDDQYWLKFKNEVQFKEKLLIILNKKRKMLQKICSRNYEDSFSVYLKYPSSQTFLLVTDVLLFYKPISEMVDEINLNDLNEFITEYIECVDFPSKMSFSNKMNFRKKLNANFTLVICKSGSEVKAYKVYHFGNVCYMVKDFSGIDTIANSKGMYDLFMGNEIVTCIQFERDECLLMLNDMILEKK
eukprot:NODE_13_length_54415_cov_0.522424.p25 type:complete len:259 gc:universal NODE_13_length_54415_cov_0.522424:16484-17260(+)